VTVLSLPLRVKVGEGLGLGKICLILLRGVSQVDQPELSQPVEVPQLLEPEVPHEPEVPLQP
jgi:hypothetical protein